MRVGTLFRLNDKRGHALIQSAILYLYSRELRRARSGVSGLSRAPSLRVAHPVFEVDQLPMPVLRRAAPERP